MEKKKKGAVLLITAFEPFDGAKTNSSHILLERMKQQDWGGRVEFFGPVPVSFEDAWPLIKQEMDKNPDLQGVIALGQAEGRPCISLERFALNWMGGGTPDNYGFKPKPGPIEQGAPTHVRSNIPWQKIEKCEGWEQSTSAGAYVCNHVMFHLARWAQDEGKSSGFVHIPLLKSQGKDKALGEHAPRMDDDEAVKHFTRVINFALENLEEKPEAKLAGQQNLRDRMKKSPPPRLTGT